MYNVWAGYRNGTFWMMYATTRTYVLNISGQDFIITCTVVLIWAIITFWYAITFLLYTIALVGCLALICSIAITDTCKKTQITSNVLYYKNINSIQYHYKFIQFNIIHVIVAAEWQDNGNPREDLYERCYLYM